MDMITAVATSKSSMSRNCRPSAPGGPTDCQVAPLSVVRSTLPASAAPAPCQPLAHAALSLTAETPRNLAVASVGVGVNCHAHPLPTAPPSLPAETPRNLAVASVGVGVNCHA